MAAKYDVGMAIYESRGRQASAEVDERPGRVFRGERVPRTHPPDASGLCREGSAVDQAIRWAGRKGREARVCEYALCAVSQGRLPRVCERFVSRLNVYYD